MDILDLYERGTAWSASKIPAAAASLDAATPCDEWDVRALVNHMLDSLRWFAGVPDGQSSPGPSPTPPDLLGDDPVEQYEEARQATLEAYKRPGALDKHGSTLGIALVDQLLHGWDLARATGQDATMPADLAEAGFNMIEGRMPNDKRGGVFKPEVEVAAGATPQQRLLAYAGRRA